MPNNPFDNRYFLGYVNHVSAQYIKVHFPSSTLLNKTIASGEEFNGGLVGNFVVIEGENHGFIGKISEIDLSEKERLALSEKAFQSSDFHPTAKVEILMSFDYYNSLKAQHSIDTFPNIGSKVYVCSGEFIQQYVSNFGEKDDDTLFFELGKLTSNKDTVIRVSQQALFGRHCAVVGTTGGGKSWTVAKLLEEMVTNDTKAILIDPTGEYSTFSKGDSNCKVKSVTFGDDVYFDYKKLTIEDLFFLVKPSDRVQAPKLKDAIDSLKMVEAYKKKLGGKQRSKVKDFFEDKPDEISGLVDKTGKKIIEFERYMAVCGDTVRKNEINIDITKLARQVLKECIRPNFNQPTLYGTQTDDNSYGNCTTLVTRIASLIADDNFNSVFHFSQPDSKDYENITEVIDKFIEPSNKKRVLRISFEKLGFEFQAREILANAIGKYLLSKSRNKEFKENPIVLFIDEAHQFLNNKVVDDYFASQSLSAFDQIAKESRKYGLFLCLATQMPRDIPIGTLSQMGTFIVHRLINYSDKEAIRQACASASAEILSFLPVLGEGEAILSGVDFSMPVTIKIDKPTTPPDSNTPKFKRLTP